MEAKQEDKCCLRNAISTEFNLLKTSETIGAEVHPKLEKGIARKSLVF